MVAVLALVAFHLTGWPRGGFVGIDVFFVITGYFVTESLLRTTAESGALPLGKFYLDRVRRIVPAATVVLVLTVLASLYVLPSTALAIGVDALFGFLFVANWHFAASGASPLAATDSASPLLHYWPLSVEEQFLIVWPLVLFGITAIAIRGAWSDARWRARIASAIGVVVVASLTWSIYETMSSPSWAYLSTVTRLWELGAGALLATAVGALARIPDLIRPILSWTGLTLIAAAVVYVDGASGFPGPWALLPVAGAALVIAAGVGREPDLQGFLRNRVSTYLGDISYSLYLAHWPVIVLLAVVMERNVYFYASAVTLTFGLALLLHYLVENPLRDFSPTAVRQARADMRHGLFHTELSTKVGAVGGLVLITLSVISYAMSGDAIGAPTL
ncbi:peptidoglycan/LPS O-acetylase OafA/YrhL [Mycolicibacterium iranicum]|uniref:Peptidoglycan/LPS O-acetylase OafA/YrhL n=1 Tax=Mycolicibacterium iranicum TaxID=912594 RepID=A0A839Q5A6_MYCIR|nr:acyltransferase [Mycolicibacterium iranicum]MBB2991260.1 peptidoglycan/LPS O-acetylase OafA/YrhL [Mycolicibacterium iranicum]